MAPTRRRSRSVSTPALPQLRHRLRRLRLRGQASPQPPSTSSSSMAPVRRRGRLASHPATTPARIPPDGSSSSPRRRSPVNSSDPVANTMKVRAIGGGGGGIMSVHRERSSLEPDCGRSAETQDPSSSSMEAMDADDEEVVTSGKHVPLPSHLLKFLKEEGENARGNKVKLLALVVHALFLDNGFVNFDPLQHGWAASIGTNILTLRYTLPSVLRLNSNSVDSVDLRFQISGNLVCIYGCVPGNDSSWIILSLDASGYGVWRIMYDQATLDDGEEEVLEVVNMIKDRLLQPLHIDICDKAGLPSPPCFMRLPTDIQIKILELLSWTDVAKMACVCSEMKELASSDELWKQRYGEVTVEWDTAGAGETRWKEKFGARLTPSHAAYDYDWPCLPIPPNRAYYENAAPHLSDLT